MKRETGREKRETGNGETRREKRGNGETRREKRRNEKRETEKREERNGKRETGKRRNEKRETGNEKRETGKRRWQMIQKSDRYRDFLHEQNLIWQLSAENYHGLELVEEKTMLIDGFKIKVQFNPQRMRSSTAKVDPNSIAARKCFLCAENRPPEQISLDLGDDFLLLVNPFPIFRTHFTIPSIHHIPQRLVANLESMFHISRLMEGFLLFYNGPECGASAPDHLHFQAGETGFLPVESEFATLKITDGNLFYDSESLKIWAFDHYIRKMISLETDNMQPGINMIEKILSRFREIQSEKIEPMLNLLCTFSKGKWIIHMFPRKQHRPSQYFAQGNAQLLISPAAVDLGGVFITPRREDFDKITAGDIADIFEQVTLNDKEFKDLKDIIYKK